jgi:hypothetical protein
MRGLVRYSRRRSSLHEGGPLGARRSGALVFGALLLAVAALAPAARAQEPVATAPIVIEGVALRQVLDAPVPLYVAPSVSDEKMRWMRDAIAIALVEVPRITALPLPQSRLEFYLFNDPRELASLSGQILRSPGPRVAPECFALAASGTPRRGIYCQADAWDSAQEALDYVAHELTHQVQQGDSTQRRALAQWFNEGLAEYVQARVLAEHWPTYAARDHWQREARVASAIHTGRLVRLRDLSTNARWQQVAGAGAAGLIYSESSLVVGWLVDTYGLPAVIDVVRRTGGPFGFDAVFEEVFGLSVEGAEGEARRAFEADLLPRYPVGLSMFQVDGPAGAVLHFAVVGFRPREWLEKDYRYENGAAAEGAATGARSEVERTDGAGFASWTWTPQVPTTAPEGRGPTTAASPPPDVMRTIRLTVRGSDGSEATQSATVTPTR